MRILCLLLLVVANIAFFTFTRFDTKAAPAGQPAETIEPQPQAAEFLQVQRPRPAPEATAAIQAEEPAPTCLEWVGIAPQDVDRSRQLLESLAASYEVMSGGTPSGPYWVRIRGIDSRAAVNDLTEQLEAAGERDVATSYDAGNGTYIISLGLFSNQANAERLHARFRHLGAVMTPEGGPPASYLVRAVDATIVEQIDAALPGFPGATTSAAPCAESRTMDSAPS
ncbi:MAG: SPOR domain-containing protein [Pseudomonadales bacterium]